MKLRTLVRTILNGGKRELRCESCGDGFTCSVSMSCWCGEVKTTDSVRKEIRAKHNDCICRKCLERAADSPPS